MPYTPTVRGRRVARELKRLRLSAGLTGEQAVAEIGWDTAKLSRMENAKMRITSGEVMELLEVYGISGDQRTELVRLAREARQKGWWHSYEDVIKSGFNDYLGLEAEAFGYHCYDTQLVPGLFQTADYATAVFRGAAPRTTVEVERNVEARLARKDRLFDSEQPLNVWQIVEEGALRRIVDGPTTMHAQLRHLQELAELPNVSLQILPFIAGVHPAIDGPFTLLTFDGYPDVLYAEHVAGCVYMEKPDQTRRGKVIFDHLRASALNAKDSVSLIRTMIDSVPRQERDAQ
ncbi:helix-turn-helix domain-containing protein [Actinomadura sp. 9N407]|uniref:helix-turn-helix domain-containing protein n=1 Tax=Actinomadura sp. 9N407 TaxID=3375154 RepID=UPI00378973A8